VQCLVGLVDLVPTLCTYAGVGCPEELAGQDLLAQRPGRRFIVSEATGPAPRHRAIRNETFKLIWQPDGAPDGPHPSAYSLYDVGADPEERNDLIEASTPDLKKAVESLTPVLANAGPDKPIHAAPSVEVDEEVDDRLRALGYAR
jgi:arylsulfatase A-like enzyme